MALRVLLSKTNSSWGVQKTGIGEQFYEHVITFDSDELRWTFLANEMFAGVDPRTLITNQPQQAFTFIDSNKAIFPVDVKNYPGENYETLLNKDFMIIFDDVINKYTFWAVEGKVKGNRNIIEYDCVRDFAFEIGYNNLFRNDRQVQMERAHVDNVIADNTKTIFTANIGIDSDNFYSENFDNEMENCIQPTVLSKFEIDYSAHTTGYSQYPDLILNYSSTLKLLNHDRIIGNFSNLTNFNCLGVYSLSYNEIYVWCYYYKNNQIHYAVFLNNQKIFDTNKNLVNGNCQLFPIFDDNKKLIYLLVLLCDISNANNAIIFDCLSKQEIKFFDFGTNAPQFLAARLDGTQLYISCVTSNTTSITYVFSNKLKLISFITNFTLLTGDSKPISFYENSPIFERGDQSPGINNHYYWDILTNTTQQISGANLFNINQLTNITVYTDNTNLIFKNGISTNYNVGNNSYNLFYDEPTNTYYWIDEDNKLWKNGVQTDYLSPDNYNPVGMAYYKTGIPTNKANKFLNSNGFCIVNCQLKNKVLDSADKKDNPTTYTFDNPKQITFNFLDEKIINGYYSFLFPNFNLTYNGNQLIKFNQFYELIIRSPDIYNITIQPFALIPESLFEYTADDRGVEIEYGNYYDNINIVSFIDNNNNKFYCLNKVTVLYNDNKLLDVYDNKINYDTNINNNFNILNIGKLYKSPYHNLQIKSPNNSNFTIYPEYINIQLDILLSYSWQADQWHYYIIPRDNYQNINTNYLYNQDLKYGSYCQNISNYSFNQLNDAFSNFWTTNKNQWELQARINQRNAFFDKVKGWEKIFGGLTAAGFGIASDNPMAIFGGIAGGVGGVTSGAQQIANSENAIKMQQAQVADLKNTPEQIKGDGSDLNGWLSKENLTPVLYEMELFPALKRQVAQHFHLFGSNLSGQFKYINEFINSRYHFNFIKCASTFENFREDVPLTNATRQIFNKSNANGVTIWHYRDPATFKGIKNYDVNNVEVKFATF